MIIKIILSTLLFASIQADLLEFNNGAILNGKVTAQNTTTLTIDIDGQTTTYSKADIKNIKLDKVVSPPPPPPNVSKAPSVDSKVIKSGTKIHVKTISSVNSAQHKKGHKFTMALSSDVVSRNGVIIIKKGTVVYANVVESQQAGRLIGASKMIITLSAFDINNKQISIQTDSINILAPNSQGRDTVGKTARAAAIGGLIDGSDGARTGAKVGIGMAILTRAKPTGVPTGTLLDFTILSDVKIK